MSSLRIIAIEPTPNPNNMKLTLDESLPAGVNLRFVAADRAYAPPHLQRLLAVTGVKSVYQVADFIALERQPGADWQEVLAAARAALAAGAAPADDHEPGPEAEPGSQAGPGSESGPAATREATAASWPEEIRVSVQVIRGIPMQVKLRYGDADVRLALPPRFKAAATQAAAATDFIAERRWVERGVRYGNAAGVGQEVVQEIDASYDDQRLSRLLAKATGDTRVGGAMTGAGANAEASPADDDGPDALTPAAVAVHLDDPDWRRRYAALDRLEPSPAALAVLGQALGDANPSVRRLATVYLGQVAGDHDAQRPQVLPLLFRALTDRAAAVRRAAGDCLSDLGDPAAIAPITRALSDPSKLVRWRAARFLYEVGDATALPALQAAQDDPEYEVRLQVRLALERIAGGREAAGPVWQQMTRRLEPSDEPSDGPSDEPSDVPSEEP